jgi:hypothetical protein
MYIVDRLVERGFNVYPEVLGFNYYEVGHPELVGYDHVFVQSDFGFPIDGITNFLTGAEHPGTYMWCCLDFSDIKQLPHSEVIDVPTVGFVGRIPFLKSGDSVKIHRGFEPRLAAYKVLSESTSICFDNHVRFGPYGGTNDWGFWNPDTAVAS